MNLNEIKNNWTFTKNIGSTSYWFEETTDGSGKTIGPEEALEIGCQLESENEALRGTMMQLCDENDVGCWNSVHKQVGSADFTGDCGNKPIRRIWKSIPICAECDALLAEKETT